MKHILLALLLTGTLQAQFMQLTNSILTTNVATNWIVAVNRPIKERSYAIHGTNYLIRYQLYSDRYFTVPATIPPGQPHYDCTAYLSANGIEIGKVETSWTQDGCWEDNPVRIIGMVLGWEWNGAGYNIPEVNPPPVVTPYFSPNGKCTEAILAEIEKATNQILVQAYSFSSEPILEALEKAAKRKVNVMVLLDKGQETAPYATNIVAHGKALHIHYDHTHAIAHNKIIIIDQRTVLTGSFNFTHAAEEHNAENLLVIQSKALAATYTSNWTFHAHHCK